MTSIIPNLPKAPHHFHSSLSEQTCRLNDWGLWDPRRVPSSQTSHHPSLSTTDFRIYSPIKLSSNDVNSNVLWQRGPKVNPLRHINSESDKKRMNYIWFIRLPQCSEWPLTESPSEGLCLPDKLWSVSEWQLGSRCVSAVRVCDYHRNYDTLSVLVGR